MWTEDVLRLTEDVHWMTSRQLSPSPAWRRNHSPASLDLHNSFSKLSSTTIVGAGVLLASDKKKKKMFFIFKEIKKSVKVVWMDQNQCPRYVSIAGFLSPLSITSIFINFFFFFRGEAFGVWFSFLFDIPIVWSTAHEITGNAQLWNLPAGRRVLAAAFWALRIWSLCASTKTKETDGYILLFESNVLHH